MLLKTGLRANKTVSDFLRETSSAKDRQIYFDKKDQYDLEMSYTTSADGKRALRDRWESWSTEFKGTRPYLQEQLGQASSKAQQRLRALDDMRNMLKDKSVTQQPELKKIFGQMLSTYDSYVNQRDFGGELGTANTADYKDMIKLNAKNTILALAESDPNAIAAYNTLFAPLFR
jgi:uncharacterized protein YeaO (DUF488 family)